MREAAWKEELLALDQTIWNLKKKRPLRHGNPFVCVSDISEQFYCEKKVELTYKLGRVETQAMQEGTKLHEEITKMEKAKLQQMIEGIAHSPFISVRFPLVAEVEGLPVVGVPDALGFVAGGAAWFVFELKTFGARIYRLHGNHAVQAKVHGLLLDAMGFNCSKLLLYVVGVRRGTNIGDVRDTLRRFLFALSFAADLRDSSKTVYVSKDLIKAVANDMKRAKLFGLDKLSVKRLAELAGTGDLSIFCLPYSHDDALETLRWAKSYWLGDRKAVPTRKLEKCRVCIFAENCTAHRLQFESESLLRQKG